MTVDEESPAARARLESEATAHAARIREQRNQTTMPPPTDSDPPSREVPAK